jgi:tetratricopeptide (TPR) repeat protein
MIIVSASEFFASQGNREKAAQALSKLSMVKTDPGIATLIRADYEARSGDPKHALALYTEATREAPQNAVLWRALIMWRLGNGQTAEAKTALEEAIQSNPKDKTDLLAVRDQSEALEFAAKDNAKPAILPFATAFIQNPSDGSAESESLAAIVAARRAKASPDQIIDRIDTLGKRYPRYLQLQIFLATVDIQAGRYDDARDAAIRATQVAPTDPEPFRLLTVAHASAFRWPEAVDAAQQWRERSLADPLPADLAIATAQIESNQPADAARRLQPYATDPKSPGYTRALPVYVKAMDAAGNSGSAATLEPLLHEGPEGRRSWIAYAIQNLDDVEAAAWLQKVTPFIPSDSINEQLLLADAWGTLNLRSGNADYSTHARQILKPLADRPSPSPAVLLAMGVREEQDGNLDRAEGLYRQLMDSFPDRTVVQNNLAMVLAKRGTKLDEAEKLASGALKNHPEIPTLYDTLAFVQSTAKNYPAAEKNLQTAIRMEPTNANYRIRLVQVLASSGQADKAREALDALDRQKPDRNMLPAPSRQQLDALRSSLAAAADGI